MKTPDPEVPEKPMPRKAKYRSLEGLQMKYFVLKPGGDDVYAKASRKALIAYAEAIKLTNYDLADDLMVWVSNLEEEMP